MRYVVCSVRDIKANVFSVPYYSAAPGVAIRQFTDAVNHSAPDNVMRNHAEDFELYQLGYFDDQHGIHEALAHPHQLAVGKDCLRPLPSA